MCAIEWNGGAATPPWMCWTSMWRGVVVALLYLATEVATAPAAAVTLARLRRRAAGRLQAVALAGVVVSAGVAVDADEASVVPAAVVAAALAAGVTVAGVLAVVA